ncbi:MAG: VOC family protein [Armatimonadota bacterium]
MEPRLTLITLGVQDLARAIKFYRDGLGFPMSSASQDDIAFFRTGGVALALYPRHLLAEDAQVPDSAPGFSGITLAHNVREREEVDGVLQEAVEAGAELVKAAEDTFWGGRSGYFRDPEGHLWEVAWNPHSPLDERGFMTLAE